MNIRYTILYTVPAAQNEKCHTPWRRTTNARMLMDVAVAGGPMSVLVLRTRMMIIKLEMELQIDGS